MARNTSSEQGPFVYPDVHLTPVSPQLKGPRLPLEIFLLIVGSARDDKKALKTFSLVSKSWMHIAREVLFAKISLRGVKPLPFLNNPHCTIFPYVQVMGIDETDDTRRGMPRGLNWLDDSEFLRHMPKFTALTSLDLESFDSLDFDSVIWAMPPAMRGRIKQLGIYNPDTPMFALTGFISNFMNLTALKCGEMHGGRQDDALARLLPTNEVLAPPPSSIKKLLFRESGHLPSNILKWFTDRHPGGIKLFRPNDLQRTHPVEFSNFIRRFRASLLKTELSISNEDDICKRICLPAYSRLILPSSSPSKSKTAHRHRAELRQHCITLASEHNCTTPAKH
jgi:hypothetical protein